MLAIRKKDAQRYTIIIGAQVQQQLVRRAVNYE